MGITASDLKVRNFRRRSSGESGGGGPAQPRRAKKKASTSSSGSASSDATESSKSASEQKRRSPDWERQVRGSTEFVRLRKESLFGAAEPGVTGLKNLGNTCFMNSALQCLSHTAPLTDYFLGSDMWKNDLNTTGVLGTGGKLAQEYAALLRELWEGPGKAIAPRCFKLTVSSFARQFSGYSQHDCQELLVYLLDGLHEDLNRVERKPYIEVPDANGRKDEVVAAEQWKNHLLRNKSIVVDLLQGQLKSTLTCPECEFVSVTFDPFMYLSLPFPQGASKGPVSLESMLEAFLQPEKLRGDEAWFCPKCKDHVEATKKFDLWKLPPILIVHLKRFRFGTRGSKIDADVSFPLDDFSFEQFASGKQRNLPHYDLYAVSRHMGSSSGGHYTAVAKNRMSGNWFCFDDATCRRIPEDKVPSKSAYVLFYQNHQITEQGYRRQSVSKPKNWPHALPESELMKICGNINASTAPGPAGRRPAPSMSEVDLSGDEA